MERQLSWRGKTLVLSCLHGRDGTYLKRYILIEIVLASAAELSPLDSAAFAAEPIDPALEPMHEVTEEDNDDSADELHMALAALIGSSSSGTTNH